VFLKEKKYLLISFIVIILDGLIIYFIPSYFNQLNYFYPMLTILLIPFIYLTNKKNYFLLIIIMGIIYDLLYSSIIFYHIILFIILISFDIKILNYFKSSLLLLIITSLINIVLYDIISFLLVIFTSYSLVTINDLLYKINHSLLFNIMSVFVLWILCKKDITGT